MKLWAITVTGVEIPMQRVICLEAQQFYVDQEAVTISFWRRINSLRILVILRIANVERSVILLSPRIIVNPEPIVVSRLKLLQVA